MFQSFTRPFDGSEIRVYIYCSEENISQSCVLSQRVSIEAVATKSGSEAHSLRDHQGTTADKPLRDGLMQALQQR